MTPGFQISVNGNTKLVRFKDSLGYPLVWIMYRYGTYQIVMEGPYDYSGTYIVSTDVAPNWGLGRNRTENRVKDHRWPGF